MPAAPLPTFPTLADVLAARRRIGGTVVRTPLRPSAALSARLGRPVYLKCEHGQITGSFKLRGATNAILSLSEDQRQRGVVAVSTGNHGRGLAHAAKATGTRAVICMSRLVPANKVEAIRALGAEVHITGASQDEAQQEVDRLVAEEGLTMLPPFDHAAIIAGQGTLGLEVMEDLPDTGVLVVPVSGGGLAAGVALAAKAIKPALRVIGVSMARGCAMHDSLKAGTPVLVEELPTLADSLGGGVGLDNRYTFPLVRALLDRVVLVSEAQIADGIRAAYHDDQQVVEGAGAVGIAALRAGVLDDSLGPSDAPEPEPVVVLTTGCNIAMDLHHRICGGEDVDVGAATGSEAA